MVLGWHLKKEISLTVIISVVGSVMAGLLAYSDIKKEIALIQSEVTAIKRTDQTHNENLRDVVINFNNTVNRIDGKLDRLIERGKP